jgi:hypothetical protein
MPRSLIPPSPLKKGGLFQHPTINYIGSSPIHLTVIQVPLVKGDLGGSDSLHIYFINTLSALCLLIVKINK